LPAGTNVSLFDEAEWAVLSTGVLNTDPPLVVEALTFTVPDDLQPLFEYLTTTGTGDTNTLEEFIAEASGMEFDSFRAMTVRDSAPPAEFEPRLSSLLRDFVSAIGIEDSGEFAAELAEIRLPVFGSQPRDSKTLKDLVEGTGNALMCIAVVAGTHAPALLALTGPVGAIITLGTYVSLGGAWATKRLRERRAARREAKATKAAADAAKAAADAKTVAAAEAARHARVVRKQEALKVEAQARKLTLRNSL
jgi:hypothetical protein